MFDSETAIEAALRYLSEDTKGLWIESTIRISAKSDDQLLAELRNALGCDLDNFEIRMARQQNRDKWLIQFVSVKTEHGDTPQGPCVIVFDDGEISHYRPM